MSPKLEDTSPKNQTGYTNKAYQNDNATSDSDLKNKKIMVKKIKVDFDDILPHIGEFGWYQKLLFLMMIPFAFFVCFVYFSQIFMTLVPEEHWCHVPDLQHLNRSERLALAIPKTDVGYDKCSMYDVNFTEILQNGIKVANTSWPIQVCKHGYEYDFTDVPYETIATQLNWVCENSTLPTLAQSIFFIGAIVGGLLFGWIADRFGRVPALAGCNIIGFIAGLLTAFTGNFWQFALCRFFVGFAFDNCFTMMYILVLEYVGPKWRTFVANMSIALFFTLASCALPFIALYISDWKIFAIVTSVPLALAFITPFVVPESARWLISQGKTDRALKILKRIEKRNGTTVDPQLYEDFKQSCALMQEEDQCNNTYSILDLFRTPRLRNITLLLIVIWMSISLVFDGHVRNVGSLGLDVFITFAVAAATELPADTFLTLVLDKWGRRWLACGSLVLSGIFSLLATAVPMGSYSAALAIMGRFCVNISYNIGLQYAAELLPTVVRAQGVAFIHIMGYVASIIAPFIILLVQINQNLPLVVLGIIGIISGVLSIFLPETLGQELPQTLADGENFGIDQKLWDFPCISKKNDDIVKDEPFKRAPTGASLRASSRGEIRSSMLQRSVRQR